MILDRLENAERYFPLHAGFKTACEFLRRTDFTSFAAGRHEVDGDRLYLMVNRLNGRGHAGAKFEAHRKHIDIQCTLAGTEEIGWRPVQTCSQVLKPYEAEHDMALFSDVPEIWITVPPGHFAIFYPEDAHAPLAASVDCQLVKAVMKVAVDWR
jgi:YhcH/YjgK/YiaL family protein